MQAKENLETDFSGTREAVEWYWERDILYKKNL